MKINAIDSFKMNKNLKLQLTKLAEVPATEQETQTIDPEKAMRALNLKGKNNLAFQGVETKIFNGVQTNLLKPAKKAVMVAMMAMAMGPMAQSCSEGWGQPDVYVSNSSTVNVDNSELVAMLKMLMDYLKGRDEKLDDFFAKWEQGQATNAQMFMMMVEWYSKWQDSEEVEQENFEMMYQLMMANQEIQKSILEQLVKNGMSYEEATSLLKELNTKVDAGILKGAEAFAQLLEKLAQIENTLKDQINMLLQYLQGSDDKIINMMFQWKEQYDKNEMSEAEYNKKMYEAINAYGNAIINVLKQNGMTDAEARAYLEKILAELGKVNESLNYIIEQLKYISNQVADIAGKQDKRWNEFLEMAKNYNGNIEELSEKLDLSNAYLYMLNSNVNELKANLEAHIEKHGEGITLDDLKEILGAESEAWKEFIAAQNALYLDGLKGDVTTIKDYISKIEAKMLTKDALQDQANRLESLLAKIDWNLAEELGVAKEIRDLIAQFEHNCDCACKGDGNTDQNEGILGDLDQIIKDNNL